VALVVPRASPATLARALADLASPARRQSLAQAARQLAERDFALGPMRDGFAAALGARAAPVTEYRAEPPLLGALRRLGHLQADMQAVRMITDRTQGAPAPVKPVLKPAGAAPATSSPGVLDNQTLVRQVQDMQTALTRLQEANAALEARHQTLTEIAALRADLFATYLSRSWRLTAPLRALRRLLGPAVAPPSGAQQMALSEPAILRAELAKLHQSRSLRITAPLRRLLSYRAGDPP
jgi:hypothetical protein